MKAKRLRNLQKKIGRRTIRIKAEGGIGEKTKNRKREP